MRAWMDEDRQGRLQSTAICSSLVAARTGIKTRLYLFAGTIALRQEGTRRRRCRRRDARTFYGRHGCSHQW